MVSVVDRAEALEDCHCISHYNPLLLESGMTLNRLVNRDFPKSKVKIQLPETGRS